MHESTEPRGARAPGDDAFALPTGSLITRSLFGGTLMGLANLVPGISGGTMLLAAGIYPRFIDALAEVTRLQFRLRSLLVLGGVGLAAGLAILLLAGYFKGLVVDHRWVMYSLFIGLTLGGVPVVWRMARPASAGLLLAAVVAFAAMSALALLRQSDHGGGEETNAVLLFVAGLAGASAMILPGVSGGYLLLLLGQYVPILSAIDAFQAALRAGDFAAALTPAVSVLIPVGLGVVSGVVVVGNLLQWLLHRYRRATLGALLGLLVGSIVGLWPFQEGVPPQIGDTIKGRVVTGDTVDKIEAADWPQRRFTPTLSHTGGSVLLILLGFTTTAAIARIGREPPDRD